MTPGTEQGGLGTECGDPWMSFSFTPLARSRAQGKAGSSARRRLWQQPWFLAQEPPVCAEVLVRAGPPAIPTSSCLLTPRFLLTPLPP